MVVAWLALLLFLERMVLRSGRTFLDRCASMADWLARATARSKKEKEQPAKYRDSPVDRSFGLSH